ncbi:MAG: phenylalanine--tRNA ligase subunit beta, partial [Dehalococcoidia bacterium]
MRVSLKWLRDYVDITLSAQELGDRLTAAGLELNDIERVGEAWDSVVVGEVVALDPHPDADRLTLATVDLGAERLTVVCGAPNIGVGQRVPFARIGARLIDGRTGEATALKRAKIRGVVSEGMVCSEKELGLSDDHDSILVLSPDAPVGVPLGDHLGDVVLDLDTTPNRPDCLSVTGVAREIAALTDMQLSLPSVDYAESGDSIHSLVSVDISAPDLCPRYCAGLITGIRVGPSPGWMQRRLASSGMRPINNVVDVTNYVMLEYGQPLHAFDYDRLVGGRIVVRRAGRGESITTIDGVERRLDPDMLVIADQERAIAVAGIMGSGASEVTGETRSVLLESANFDRVAIRRGCDRLRLRSEASLRFDKGLNSGLPPLPLRRAMQLLLEVAGGRASRGVIDVYPGKSRPEAVSVSAREVERLAGLKIGVGSIRKILTSLGFEFREGGSGSQVSVIVPYWRSDIRCTADLVEEIVRIAGYDKIPAARLSAELPRQQSKTSPMLRRRTLRRQLGTALTGLGFQEILTYPLVSLERLQKLSPNLELKTRPLRVANPMSKEQEYLRTALRSGVLTTLAHNQRVETAGIKLFEIGKVF